MAGADDTGAEKEVSLAEAKTSVDEEQSAELGGMDHDLSAGDEVGEYVIDAKIGEGGFGTVYRATHPVIGKEAAVKVLARQFSADPEMVSRFVSEARVVNTIRHNNIIDVFSFGRLEDGRRYFVMELLDGVPLDVYLKQVGPLEPKQVLAIMRGVAKALDAAHDKSVVHRDLKPDNIFLSFDDEGRPIPKLLDFGIAKLRGDVATTGHKTRTGAPIGTPHYMAPEQCLGDEVDGRTDVYAFGVVCFEALTGKPPFDADSYLALMTKHTTAERPPASGRRPDLGKKFDDALRKMMALEPDERPQSVMQALELLAIAAGESLSSTTPSLPLPQANDPSSADLEGAKTAMDASSRIGPPESTSRAPLLIGGVVVVGIGLYLATGGLAGPNETQPSPASSTTTTAAPRETTVSSATSAAAAPPSAAPQPSAAAVAHFAVTLETKTKGAKAFLDDRELGPLPGPFDLEGDRGSEVTLTVKAAGHFPAKVTVVLEPDQKVDVVLRPVPKKKLNQELEEF